MRLRDDSLQGVCACHAFGRLAAVLALIAVGAGTLAVAAPPPAGVPAGATAGTPATMPATGRPAQPTQPPAVRQPAAGVPAPGTIPPALQGGQRPVVPSTAPAGPPPKFRCDELVYNFPEVWTGDVVEHSWVVHNDGVGVLEILSVQSTCGCTVLQDYCKQLQPGAEGKITVKLNTRGLHHEVGKTINVRTNDPAASQIALQLKGKVKPRLILDPLSGAQFGTVTAKTPFPLSKVVKVTNNTDKPLKLEVTPPLAKTAYTATVRELEAGKVYEVTISVDKDKLIEGNNYSPIMLKTGFPEEPEFALPASLTYPPLIQMSTASLAVSTPATAAFHREVTLNYTAGGPMKILSVTANEPNITVQAKEMPVAPPPAAPNAPGPAVVPKVPGQSWVITVDIPMGWDPPPPATQPSPGAVPPGPPTFEIVAKTDVPEKPELKLRLFTYPQKPTVNAYALVGTLAPQVALTDNLGKSMQIGGATGHVTVTSFFTSWCPHCKRMLPILQKLAATYAQSGVTFNLISVDQTAPAAEVAKVVTNLGVSMPYAVDARQLSGGKYGAAKIPMTFMIGKNGVIEAVNQGCSADFEQKLKEQLDLLLAGKDRNSFPVVATARPAPTTPTASTRPAPANTVAPLLMLDTLTQDMGAFKPGSTGKFSLHVRNGGGQPLNLTNVTPTAGLVVDPASPKVLQPNTPAALTVQFPVPKEPGSFRHELVIESNDATKPKVTVTLNGTVRKLIEVDPVNVVDFGRRPVTFEMPRMATLTWNGEGAVNFTGIESSSPKFEASLRPIQQGPNYMVLIKAKPPFDLGDTTANITVTTDCKEQPSIVIPVRLTQPERIEITPPAANVAKAARLQEATVAIMNNGTTSLHILGLTVSNPAKIRTQFYPEVDGLSYRLKVTLLPGYTAPAGGDKIVIRTDDAQFPEIVVPVALTEGTLQPASISQLPKAQ